VLRNTFELGGYFRRWRGGVLQRWSKNWSQSGEVPAEGEKMTLEERLTLAFLKVSREVT
jgi:protein phosphatase PTC6